MNRVTVGKRVELCRVHCESGKQPLPCTRCRVVSTSAPFHKPSWHVVLSPSFRWLVIYLKPCISTWLSQEWGASLPGPRALAPSITPVLTSLLRTFHAREFLNSVFALMAVKALFLREKLLTFAKVWWREKGWAWNKKDLNFHSQPCSYPSTLVISDSAFA